MKQLLCTLIICLLSSPFSKAQTPKSLSLNKVIVAKIDSTINPATFDFLQGALKKARKQSADLLLIELDTPGGLVTTTKDILTLFGESSIPIALWVRPEGASATSAGAIIASGAHFLFMAKGTNIGAASPIGIGGDIDKKTPNEKNKGIPGLEQFLPGQKKQIQDKSSQEKTNSSKDSAQDQKSEQGDERRQLESSSDVKNKAVNDLVALVRGLSEARGRNPKPFELMITKASSFTYSEALEQNVADGVVNSYSELFKAMDGKSISVMGKEVKVEVQGPPELIVHEMGLGLELLNILANPSLAYLLFLIGAALIYFELQAPGGMVAGACGALFLLLAGLGFQVLPLNFGALGLILLAFVLFIIELYVTSFGILSVAGILSLLMGSLFLFRSESGNVDVSHTLIYSTVFGISGFIILMGVFLFRDWKKAKKQENLYTLNGKKGLVTSSKGKNAHNEFLYSVKIHGEIWEGISEQELGENDEVQVLEELDQMKIKIVKVP